MRNLALFAAVAFMAALPAFAQVPNPGPPRIVGLSAPKATGDAVVDALNQGRFEANEGHCDKAVPFFSNALQVNPDLVPALRGRAGCKAQLKDWEGAVTDMDRLLALLPESTSDRYNLAFYLKGLGQPDRALVELDLVNVRKPSAVAFTTSAEIWEAKGDLTKALRDLDRAVSLAGPGDNPVGLRAELHFRRGEWEAALRDCDAALQYRSSDERARYLRGLAKLKLGGIADGEADMAAAEVARRGVGADLASRGIAR